MINPLCHTRLCRWIPLKTFRGVSPDKPQPPLRLGSGLARGCRPGPTGWLGRSWRSQRRLEVANLWWTAVGGEVAAADGASGQRTLLASLRVLGSTVLRQAGKPRTRATSERSFWFRDEGMTLEVDAGRAPPTVVIDLHSRTIASQPPLASRSPPATPR